MILSAGLTPAWQQILEFSSFRYGEVNRAIAVHWLAQGKALNAGIAGHHLGGPDAEARGVGCVSGRVRRAVREGQRGGDRRLAARRHAQFVLSRVVEANA